MGQGLQYSAASYIIGLSMKRLSMWYRISLRRWEVKSNLGALSRMSRSRWFILITREESFFSKRCIASAPVQVILPGMYNDESRRAGKLSTCILAWYWFTESFPGIMGCWSTNGISEVLRLGDISQMKGKTACSNFSSSPIVIPICRCRILSALRGLTRWKKQVRYWNAIWRFLSLWSERDRRPSTVEAAGKEKAPEASTKSQLATWFCPTARGCGYPAVIARKSSREHFQGDVPRQTCLAYWW